MARLKLIGKAENNCKPRLKLKLYPNKCFCLKTLSKQFFKLTVIKLTFKVLLFISFLKTCSQFQTNDFDFDLYFIIIDN
jgi:hypothetical protein